MTDAAEPTVRLTRWLNASPRRVFEAWTRAQDVARWLSPRPDIAVAFAEVDARPGGAYRIGFRNPESGHVNVVAGRYLEIDPPARLVMSWAWQPPHDEFPDAFVGADSVVTVELVGVDGGAQLTLTHRGLPGGAITDRHAWGWNGALDRLTTVFSTASTSTQGDPDDERH